MTTEISRAIGALSLAKRAGKLLTGFEAVGQAARSGRAKLIVTANDISERTLKKTRDKANGTVLYAAPFGSREAETVFKKRFVIAALTDENFVKLFLETCERGNKHEEDDQ